MSDSIQLVLLGCGNIAQAYADSIARRPETLRLHGCLDLDPDRTRAFAEGHGCRAYASLEEVLAEPGAELIVNLAIHHAHYATTRSCLLAGKPVFSEKPLALETAQAAELVGLAEEHDLYLGAAPSTFLGEAAQTAWKRLREGAAGEVRLVYAEVNHGRLEAWHPSPGEFYRVGPLFDVGVYPLTLISAFLGPFAVSVP